MRMSKCPACSGMNFPGWSTCEDCGCPKGADGKTSKSFWYRHKPSYLARINRREPVAHHARVLPAKWRVVGQNPDGSVSAVWGDDPVDEAQAREWVGWTERRVAAGKATFTKVTLLNPAGEVVLTRDISVPKPLVAAI